MAALKTNVFAIAAAMMAASCGRTPSQAPALSAVQTQPTADAWSDPKEIEVLRAKGREALGSRLCASLDRTLRYWALASHEEVRGTRFLTVKTSPDAMQDWAFVGVSPEGDVFMNLSVASRISATMNGLHDIDGDGSKEVAIWIWSGGNGGYDDCYFVKLEPKPQVLGGVELCPTDCGRAVDLDHDGLVEFEIPDITLADRGSLAGDGMIVPMIYGYRAGRFVDLTARLARKKLTWQIESAKARLRRLARLPEDQQVGWWPAAITWYACARLLGQAERAIVREMKAALPSDRWTVFAQDLPELHACLKERKDRFFTLAGDRIMEDDGSSTAVQRRR